MSETTGITWTDSTFNPWAGCTKVSPGCESCYAEARMDKRLHFVRWGAGEPRRRTSAKNWGDPVKWEREHAAFFAEHGRRRRVFCASLADVFDNEVPTQWREDLFNLIKATPHLDWLLLTKRIGNVARMLPNIAPDALGAAYPNVWLGITVVNPEEADRDIGKLLAIRAVVRFLSLEPLLAPIDLTRVHRVAGDYTYSDDVLSGFRAHKQGGSTSRDNAVQWVIVGGESGHQARPFAIEWARDIVKQCQAAGVPVHVKQMGAHTTWNGMSGPGEHWPHESGSFDTGRGYFRKHLVDKAGADPTEWPEDLRVRQWPQTAA